MSRTTQGKPTTSAPVAPAPFFKLRAQYQIAPDANTLALLDDFRLLFERGMDAIETEIDTFTGAQWAGVYAMRQAWGVFEQLEARTRAIEHQAQT